ncbi:MAG: hypothetical protein GYA52_07515 [Chloroflexi bacterium]|jgi:hypothetical protein|nr:hypothetical protein [Chloroflexota bacterium]
MDENVAGSIKRRERVKADADKSLLHALKCGDQNALARAMAMRNESALAAVEETIALYSGNQGITFYQPGGMFLQSELQRDRALEELEKMALSNELLQDPAYSQYCISRLGREVGNIFLQELYRTNAQVCYGYQLLGIHMQLVILIDKLI